MTVRVWLSLGSNIEPEANIRSAVAALKRRFGDLIVSPVYENEPVGFDGDPFLNLVVGFDTKQSAKALADILRQIEDEHGRVRDGNAFSPRTLDIDLLTYGQRVIHAPGMHLPRDEIKRYAFVLLPLSQVAGDELHPIDGVSYSRLWQQFDKSDQGLRAVELDLN